MKRNRLRAGQAPASPALPARRLRVIHLLATMPVGGAEDLVAAIVQGLDPQRFAASVLTLGPSGPVGQELRARGYEVVSLGLDIKRTSAWRIVGAVRRRLKTDQPDILHTHLYHPNLYGRLGALGLGLAGVVASVHNSYIRVKFHRRVWNFLLAWSSDRVLAVSPRVYRDIRKFDGVPTSRLLLIPNGISLTELSTPLTRAEARERLQVSGLVIGTMSRLEEQKGHAYLLAALPKLSQEIEDFVVLIAGEGRLRERLLGQARDLGVENQVRFLGNRRDVPEIQRALDIFVQPSLWEGLPLALLKAMGAGLPVVATRVSGCMDAVIDGGNGRLVEPGDTEALARVILELYRHPEERWRLGEAARRTVIDRFSLETMLKRLEELYLDLWRMAVRKKTIGG